MSRRPPPKERARGERPNDQRPRGERPIQRAKPEAQRGPFRAPSPELVTLYGAHAVREALKGGRRKLLALYATETALPRIADAAKAAGLEPHIVDARDLSRHLGEEAVHQGLLLEARPLPEADIADIESKSGLVLALDQITDPHNVGAILRTACAFGVDALIVTERHSPEFTGVLAKAASGALEHVTIVSVVNLARALDELRDRGYSVVGLDSEGAAPIETIPLAKPLALVLGAEGKGLRRLTRERCDLIARLDLPGPIKSLNVSNACAAALSVAHLRLRDAARD
ncbi:23S rRNA (guanosine(2251)-2'-O)-methyltransferase RlmB [Methylocystis sp. MJC1]|uniref:23S rRNA (guanosine(2251)-2'-O)-methyltransferase RlmB n=1 Tax=Methylocystis sp. MJC1 TaxID=2654282 RepID=UPI0013ED1F8E|nr:23S rRNA (guanosine(2251)-2'-O)-methyltransferase RlmB [Methylocystis sp. MJC1]KAF2989202.1 putative TrmH family tRNA/rRNA methyltransferase [Methylocystis sp. MJC1]MBU6526929.1 23S rRNA (guanosine(2251)-2'-O)-methyltransferase RlmB [Methylocystis sp. MJC1]UZX13366.1 23S rRNA (guanosine(2251)-2'-O)-methyltransferase RlmB [Methylocystis sp. MJC1]